MELINGKGNNMKKSISLQKRDKKKPTVSQKKDKKQTIFLVETILTFRHRYLVEAECAAYADDDVTMNDGIDNQKPEWQQKYLGETIIGTRLVTDAEISALDKLDGKTDGSPWVPYTEFVWTNK